MVAYRSLRKSSCTAPLSRPYGLHTLTLCVMTMGSRSHADNHATQVRRMPLGRDRASLLYFLLCQLTPVGALTPSQGCPACEATPRTRTLPGSHSCSMRSGCGQCLTLPISLHPRVPEEPQSIQQVVDHMVCGLVTLERLHARKVPVVEAKALLDEREVGLLCFGRGRIQTKGSLHQT